MEDEQMEGLVSTVALPTLGKITALALGADGTVFMASRPPSPAMSPAAVGAPARAPIAFGHPPAPAFGHTHLGGFGAALAPAATAVPTNSGSTNSTSALFVLTQVGFVFHLAGSRSHTGYLDGEGPDARFDNPRGLAVASDGSLLVADTKNNRLRRVSPHGTVSTVAGGEEVVHAGVLGSGHRCGGFADGVGTAARFYNPWGIVVDCHGTIYVSDCHNNCIRKVTPADWTVSTLCGKKEAGFADGPAAVARFNCPTGLALDMDGDLIVADSGNHCIRRVALSDGRVSTVGGSRDGGDIGKGFEYGEAAAARFNAPQAVAVDGNNAILVADGSNRRVRMIAKGRVTTLAGSPEAGKVDGKGASACFGMPHALAMDARGRLLLADSQNDGCLRVVEASLVPPPRLVVQPAAHLAALQTDYGKLLWDTELTDVTFLVDGEHFPAHRCVLAARSPFFKALFSSGQGMKEEESRAVGKAIAIKEVKAGAFRVLLRFLYTHQLPHEEDCGEGLKVGEMVQVADRMQALELCRHCVEQFRGVVKVSNVIERLVLAHDLQLPVLEEAAMEFLAQHAITFKKDSLATLDLLKQHPDLLNLSVEITKTFIKALG
mmetsp:Transcript_50931/g.74597  ORF Transcript_50931/g.74597 Transcript_50931/m.74597 type:complete len:604 (+) Transcript_50931:10-1821(+)